MTEWEKKEEQHCQALEEAEEIIRKFVDSSVYDEEDDCARFWGEESIMIQIRLWSKAWLKKWCKNESN